MLIKLQTGIIYKGIAIRLRLQTNLARLSRSRARSQNSDTATKRYLPKGFMGAFTWTGIVLDDNKNKLLSRSPSLDWARTRTVIRMRR